MSRKGVFIPDITVEMFRNATLESVEEFMTSGQMEDIEIPEPPTVAFLCKDKGTEYCHHTKHIEQARNFEKVGPNQWMEKEPKRGKWTEEFDESANPFFQKRWRCSACNDYNYYGRPDFCPCCGADMREGDAE